MPKRSDPDKHREQVRSANRARYRADKRLRDMFPDDFARLYAEEASKEGVTPVHARQDAALEEATAVAERVREVHQDADV